MRDASADFLTPEQIEQGFRVVESEDLVELRWRRGQSCINPVIGVFSAAVTTREAVQERIARFKKGENEAT